MLQAAVAGLIATKLPLISVAALFIASLACQAFTGKDDLSKLELVKCTISDKDLMCGMPREDW